MASLAAKKRLNIRLASVCAAAVTLLIGVGSTAIGIYMANNCPGIPSDTVFVEFVLTRMPSLLSGLVLAGLLMAILGCCASLSLSVSDMFVSDVYVRLLRKGASARETLWAIRLGIVGALSVAVAIAFVMNGEMLMDMNSITCASRAVLILLPSLTALYMKRPPSPRVIAVSGVLGILVYAVGYVLWKDVADPVYLSLLSGAAVILCSMLWRNMKGAPNAMDTERPN